MHETDEQLIISKAQDGDREAFTALVDIYSKELYRYLYRLSGSHADTDDLLQDVFFQVFRKLSTFREGSNFRSWIYTIARNRFLNLKRKLRYESLLFEQVEDIQTGTEDISQTVPSEMLEEITRAVNSLPEDQKQVVILFIMQNLPHKEIAEILDCKEETVRWRLYEARKKLKTKLSSLLEG